MKILFVCRSNVARSQMAMEFYSQFYPGEAASAGTIVDVPGQVLSEREPAKRVLAAMKELEVDMSNNVRTQLNSAMLKDFDKVVVLAEPESIPDYLRDATNVEIWEVDDPRGKAIEQVRVIRDDIKKKVEELAKRLHQPK